VQRILNKEDPKLLRGGGSGPELESKEARGSAADPEQGGSKTIKREEDQGLKEKVKRHGECSGSGTRRIQNYKGEEDPCLKEKVKRQGECCESGTRRNRNY
jgi:hypothetical protein